MPSIKDQLKPLKTPRFLQLNKSKGILDDHSVRKSVNTREGRITHTPTVDTDIVNKKYVDDTAGSPIVTHASTTGKTTDDHHAEVHSHTHASTTGRTATDHHDNSEDHVQGTDPNDHLESHNMASHSDDDTYNINTSGTATIGNIIYANGNVGGLSLDVLRSAYIHINLEVNQDLTVTRNITVGGTVDGIDVGTDVAANTTHAGLTNEHLDWTADQGATNIHAGNYTDTDTQLSEADITTMGFTKDVEVDWTVSQAPAVIHANNYTDTGDTTAHASFSQLDYASAGHTGFAAALGADDNYVTDAEKADLHANTLDHTQGTDPNDHLESHNAASHSDITASGADIDDAVSKKHTAGTDPNDHLESHNMASHSDDNTYNILTSGTAGVGILTSTKVISDAGAGEGKFQYSNDNYISMRPAQWFLKVASGWSYEISAQVFRGYTDGLQSLGNAAKRWKEAYINRVIGGQSTITASTDALDVTAMTSVLVDTSSGNKTIGGLANGVAGQVVHIIKILSPNNMIIEHLEGSGTQKIVTPDNADITITNYGGVTLVFRGTEWYVVSQ